MARLLLLALVLALPAAAQSDDLLSQGRRALDAATLDGSVDALQGARAALQLAAAGDGPAGWATYYTALADFRLSYALWGNDPDRASEHAALGADALADLRRRADSDDLRAEAAALQSGLLGARIGLDPSLGMQLGQASQQAMAEAARLAPGNPRVQFFQAATLLNTPPEWGGDPERAVELLASAVATFEAAGDPGDPAAPTWGHADAAAWLGLAHLMRGDAKAARGPIETAERLDPNSTFVRFKLRPWLDSLGE
ncbi:hypothetical protein [Rubrivirga sp.]|uniref:hypothetical protein n=1 Tax=Rubrivirga sp. TaxID=1885344 RepID=UPI003B51E0C1